MNYLETLIQKIGTMQWSDYLDIILVAFLIYKLLPMFRASGTSRVAKVIFAILVLAWFTETAELNALNFLINQVLAVGLIAVIVLFQPELRRMLDHLGNVKLGNLFGSSKPVQEMENVIAQTVMACEVMSREKVGALIVFSREQRLDEYFKTGTQIDGQVSEQLLRNIFVNKAPLHDGAVIIQGGKIAAAGCVLPVSNSTTLSKDLGTRHRAGVGISEVLSDTLTIIVSEETGKVSIARGGNLIFNVDGDFLRAKLLELQKGKEQETKTKKGYLLLLQ